MIALDAPAAVAVAEEMVLENRNAPKLVRRAMIPVPVGYLTLCDGADGRTARRPMAGEACQEQRGDEAWGAKH
jgi:hypothetical protein